MDTLSAGNTNVERHPIFYFTDGDIILSAPLMVADASTLRRGADISDVTVLFKIHKFQLAANSDVFSSMLELPTSPNNVNETYDGVPLVAMSDSAEEVEDLLRMLYKPWEIKIRQYNPNTCIRLENVLAMSTKYQFTSIRDYIVFHLEADWPTTLTEWDMFEARIKMMSGNRDLFSNDDLPEPASALSLARKYDVKSILPAVYYDLSRFRPLDDWDDKEASDELIEIDLPPYFGRRVARWQLLSKKDLMSLLRGKCAMQDALVGKFSKPPGIFDIFGETTSCSTGNTECKKLQMDIFNQIKEALNRSDTDILKSLSRIAASTSGLSRARNNGPCINCVRSAVGYLERNRGEIWSSLPTYFGS
ncbi:hypothetical protein M0805_004565 [Coniferiporia weirii]|nr:hypothetical protein M0805_004565 [Coniferiporia weirii]